MEVDFEAIAIEVLLDMNAREDDGLEVTTKGVVILGDVIVVVSGFETIDVIRKREGSIVGVEVTIEGRVGG